MIFSASVPAFAAGMPNKWGCDDPVIYLSGDSNDIYYDNDSKTFRIDDLFDSSEGENGDTDYSSIYEATANILLPFILEGIAFDMTVDNCHTEVWETDKTLEKPQAKEERIVSLVMSLIKWVTTIFKVITEKLQESNLTETTGLSF